MSTKVGLIAEGPIDHALVPALLSRIAADRVGIQWPIDADDLSDVFPIRRRGHGGVLESVRTLVGALDSESFDHAFFVVVLDRRTKAVQEQVRQLIRPHPRFIVGIAIEEIEAWWLADRTNTLAWSGLAELPEHIRYTKSKYHAESDDDPKATLDEVTRESDRFDRCYGQGNLDRAREFAEDFWRPNARLDEIKSQCRQGFGRFESDVVQQFRSLARPKRRA